ncbi:MAG: hypothetical protein LBD93_04840 [Treponema sp.]|nr:hypothetical protein [Treponema sp.]
MPLSNGKNELDGQTFNGNGTNWQEQRYVFSGTTYTYTDSDWMNTSATYAWNVEGRRVYLKLDTYRNMTNVQYFEWLLNNDDSADEFATVTDRYAAETNGLFVTQEGFYNLTEKTID